MSKPVIVEEIYEKPIQRVWKAITELDEMTNWFFDNIPDFKAEVGFKTRFIVSSEERDFIHLWKITEVIPQSKIVYDWSYENYKGNSLAIFELFEKGANTQLKVTCIGLESFPQGIPEFAYESCLGGWNYFIKDHLKNYLSV